MPPPDRMEKSSANSIYQTAGTNCTISGGTPAVPPFAPMRRIRTWNDATLSYLDYAQAAFTLWIPSRIRQSSRSLRSLSPKRCLPGPVTRGPTPYIAVRREFTLAPWAPGTAAAQAEFSFWITLISTCWGVGKWIVARKNWLMIFGGIDALISSEWGIPNRLENGLDPEHLLSSG